MKRLIKISKFFLLIFLTIMMFFLYLFKISNMSNRIVNSAQSKYPNQTTTFQIYNITTTNIQATPTLFKPLTFAQMNVLYGPCINIPVFLYHHVQSKYNAMKNKQTALTTFTDTFEEQIQYLIDKGYQTIDIYDLFRFFKGEETSIPEKSVILTFDDGYSDFYDVAFPILQKYNLKAVVFLSTGLIEKRGYLTWEEISKMNKTGQVYFGNHTWFHSSEILDDKKSANEIITADQDLSQKGLNIIKVFAYPYGVTTSYTQNYLKSSGYNLAFTTKYGKTLCAKNSLMLPRVRANNFLPNYYGL